MHNVKAITKQLFYLGGNDRRIALFESAFPVPRGVSYNSYLLLDEKTVLFDTVDSAISDNFLENLEAALGGRPLDCVVVHHMEPDHSATLLRLLETYPAAEVFATQKTAQMLKNYFPHCDRAGHAVKEGDTMSAGRHTIRFIMAPWCIGPR